MRKKIVPSREKWIASTPPTTSLISFKINLTLFSIRNPQNICWANNQDQLRKNPLRNHSTSKITSFKSTIIKKDSHRKKKELMTNSKYSLEINQKHHNKGLFILFPNTILKYSRNQVKRDRKKVSKSLEKMTICL